MFSVLLFMARAIGRLKLPGSILAFNFYLFPLFALPAAHDRRKEKVYLLCNGKRVLIGTYPKNTQRRGKRSGRSGATTSVS